MRVLVCGGRTYYDFERVDRILDVIGPTFIIQGGAKGADQCAANWAAKRGVPMQCYPAHWDLYGASAGPKRNRQMLVEGKPDIVVAFPGGVGTSSMIGAAMQRGVPVIQIPEVS